MGQLIQFTIPNEIQIDTPEKLISVQGLLDPSACAGLCGFAAQCVAATTCRGGLAGRLPNTTLIHGLLVGAVKASPPPFR